MIKNTTGALSVVLLLTSFFAFGGTNSSIKTVAPNFGEVVKNADGTILAMNFSDAIQYCKNAKGHLPTSREWAALATSNGAKGVLEVSDFKNDKGYRLIQVHNEEGQTTAETQFDQFYYSTEGYPIQTGDDRFNFWSTEDGQVYSSDKYVFSCAEGWLSGFNSRRADLNAVRCVF